MERKRLVFFTIAACMLVFAGACKSKKSSITTVVLEVEETVEYPPPPPKIETYKGVLKNMIGLDGCGWMIMLDDGTKLQPLNPSAFSAIVPVEGKIVTVSYVEKIGVMTTCMSGKTVTILNVDEEK